jgi:UPF0755 protein
MRVVKHVHKLILCCTALLLFLGCGLDQLFLETYIESKKTALQTAAGSDDTPITFTVESGQSVATIAGNLKARGLIADTELFRRYLQYKRLDAGIQAGSYILNQTMTIPEIARSLQTAHAPEQQVTLPEGRRIEEVAEFVGQQTMISSADFLALAQTGWRETSLIVDYPFLAELPAGATLEGYLFPDTYRLSMEASAYDLISRMLQNFDQQVTAEIRAGFTEQGLSLYQGLTVAAIVEREAVVPSERPLIAGVFLNRVRDRWFLGADPTVQYALGYQAEEGTWWKRRITFADLEVASPYNTYRNVGMPPGPIANPGIEAIRATAFPTVTDFFFFMVECDKNDGSHVFAVTEAEHLANYSRCSAP